MDLPPSDYLRHAEQAGERPVAVAIIRAGGCRGLQEAAGICSQLRQAAASLLLAGCLDLG
eukprot:6086587-Alexandrium_andersonii.AAC.1